MPVLDFVLVLFLVLVLDFFCDQAFGPGPSPLFSRAAQSSTSIPCYSLALAPRFSEVSRPSRIHTQQFVLNGFSSVFAFVSTKKWNPPAAALPFRRNLEFAFFNFQFSIFLSAQKGPFDLFDLFNSLNIYSLVT